MLASVFGYEDTAIGLKHLRSILLEGCLADPGFGPGLINPIEFRDIFDQRKKTVVVDVTMVAADLTGDLYDPERIVVVGVWNGFEYNSAVF